MVDRDRDRPAKPGHDLTNQPATAQPEDLKWKSRNRPAGQPRLLPESPREPPRAPLTNQRRWIRVDPAVSDWVLMRLVPLLCRIDLDEVALSSISNRVATTDSSLLWGLLVRLLAVHRHPATLHLLKQPEGVRDHRAAAAAFIDLGEELPDSMQTGATEAAIRALRRAIDETGGAPLPKVESLL